MSYPTPHGDKLKALLRNKKLPDSDRPRVGEALSKYDNWKAEIEGVVGTGIETVEPLIQSLNRYKLMIDLELVFDSPNDFIYRQKGQLKIDSTVLEEFLPQLVGKVFSTQLSDRGLILGPSTAFSQLLFDSSLLSTSDIGSMTVRSKDHDFAIFRPIFLRASHQEDFGEFQERKTNLAYVAAEIKTNLDKTMFQEASSTAHDLKIALPNSRYFLLCEWLDMMPISTAVTSIEEVIILRKAKRLSSQIRGKFDTAAGREAERDDYINLGIIYLTTQKRFSVEQTRFSIPLWYSLWLFLR